MLVEAITKSTTSDRNPPDALPDTTRVGLVRAAPLREKAGICNVANVDLSQPASVHWRNPSPGRGAAFSRLERRFASLKNAVRFVMEDLTEFPQSTAWIAIHADNLTFPDIVVLYARLSSAK